MIGDRPDTDMLIAHNAGIDGCLVFTGVTTSMSELEKAVSKDPRIKPAWLMNSFGVLDMT
jgi:ribonucleotide monophosphatase NagD (HAD superfamily)